MKVYVVTNAELGWDCVCGVYMNKRDALLDCLDYYNQEIPEEDIIDFNNMTDKELERFLNKQSTSDVIHEKEVQ